MHNLIEMKKQFILTAFPLKISCLYLLGIMADIHFSCVHVKVSYFFRSHLEPCPYVAGIQADNTTTGRWQA